MHRAPVLTLAITVAAFLALPVSVHFEGNEATGEPFLYVFPLAVAVAAIGVALALRRRSLPLSVLNAFVGGVTLAYWIWLATYKGD